MYFKHDSDNRVWNILAFASLEEECWNVLPRRRFHPSPRSRPTLEICRELSPSLFHILRPLYRSFSCRKRPRASVAPLSLKARRRDTVGKSSAFHASHDRLTFALLFADEKDDAGRLVGGRGVHTWPRAQRGKSSLPHRRRRRPGKSFPTSRSGCFLFLLFISVSRDRRSFLQGTADSRFVFLRPASVSELSRTINDGTLRNYSRHRNDSQKGSTPSRK